MAGVKGLRKIQIGLEATSAAGTAVDATAQLRYNGMIADERETVFPEEQIGILGGADRAYQPKLMASLAMTGEATFEQLPYFFNASICTAAASVDGAGSGYVYEYPFPTTSIPTINTYTLETGDNQEAEEMSYGYISEWTLSGNSGEAWMIDATWQGRTATVAAFSTSTTLPTVEELLFGKTKLYIDSSSDAFGTTLKSNTLLNASLKFTSGWMPVFAADGEIYYSFIKRTDDDTALEITFEHDATGAAEKVAWRAGTPQNIRLICEGSALTSAGTAYTYKTLIIDLAGKWESIDPIDEIDGNDVVKGTFRVRYNADATIKATMTVVNELDAMP